MWRHKNHGGGLGTIVPIMANASTLVNLPPEIQRLFPAGVLLHGFDGEIVYRHKNNGKILDSYAFSLLLDPSQPRPWTPDPIQITYMPIEPFNGHAATVYFLSFPTKQSNSKGLLYRVESFAAISHSTQQCIWVTFPGALELIFEGPIDVKSVATEMFKVAFGGAKKRIAATQSYVNAVDQVVMYLRSEMKRKLQGAASGGRL